MTHYLTEGCEDRLLITIPKGGYVPQFTLRENDSPSLPQILGDERLNAGRTSGVFPTEAAVDQVPVVATSSTPPLSPLNASIQKHPRFLVSIFLPLVMLLIVLSGVILFLQNRSSGAGQTAAEQVPTLMVLPFENDSGDPAQNIFAKGATEEVIGALILFRNILVLGADTSFRFRTETSLNDPVPGVHVDYVLKGSLNRIESQIQINV